MIQLHVSNNRLDRVLERLPDAVRSCRHVAPRTPQEYVLIKPLAQIASIEIERQRETTYNDKILQYIELHSMREHGECNRNLLEQICKLKRAIREELCTALRNFHEELSSELVTALMLRVCPWETTVKFLLKLYRHVKSRVEDLPLSDILSLIWVFSKYHLHSIASALLREVVTLKELRDDLDVLRVASLILFGILEVRPNLFSTCTLKVHDSLRYFTWVLFLREFPITARQEFFLIFECCGRACLLSNASYVSDQVRMSLPPETYLSRLRDHVFLVYDSEPYGAIICATEDSPCSVHVKCDKCVVKSRDIDAKLSLDQPVDVAPGDTLLLLGERLQVS